MDKPSLDKAVLYNLVRYLKANMPNIQDVRDQFPNPSDVMKMPCISVSLGNPEFTPLDPYFLSKDAVINNRAKVRHIVAEYDFALQLDIWCRDKFERFRMIEEFFSTFNREITPMGLRLQMTDYYGVWCQYDMTGHVIDGSEANSQRSEWRATINLTANTRAVRESNEYMINTIENNLDTLDNEIEL